MLNLQKGLQNLLNQIEQDIPYTKLNVHFSENFASSRQGHRAAIRTTLIADHINFLSQNEIENIRDLTQLPRCEPLKFSISHNQKLGAYSSSSISHGIDLELAHRISEPIIRRVSSNTELADHFPFAFIWCAKEAALKSFQNLDLLMQDIVTENWQLLSQNETSIWRYRVKSALTLELNFNIGYVFEADEQIFSVFFS